MHKLRHPLFKMYPKNIKLQTRHFSSNFLSTMVMASDDSSHIQFNRWLAKPLPGEEVVITGSNYILFFHFFDNLILGISGRFPASKNVREFRDNLFEKKDMFSSVKKRWIVDHKDIPSKGGLLPEIDKFDAGNFGIHHRQATYMDPTMRNFLEVAIESVMDAGVHPKELEGSKTGVLVAYSFSDLEVPVLTQADEAKTFKLTGYVLITFIYLLKFIVLKLFRF